MEVRDAVWAEEPHPGLAMAAPEKATEKERKRKPEEAVATAATKKPRRLSGEIQCTLCRKFFLHGDIRRHNMSAQRTKRLILSLARLEPISSATSPAAASP